VKTRFPLLPTSLARRFALVVAGLAAGAVLLTSLASWWFIDQQYRQSLDELREHERAFHTATVGSQLLALVTRMSEVADSSILATGLVDSAGREKYLVPFLAGIRQVNGVPVQVVFTDFEGKEIASNGTARFTSTELDWLRRELATGRANATIVSTGSGFDLIALEPLAYARSQSPDGALFYKILLKDIHLAEGMRLEWGRVDEASAETLGETMVVEVPPVLASLNLRVRGPQPSAMPTFDIAPQYVAILLVATILFAVVIVAGLALARLLTRDLRELEAFSSHISSSGLTGERAPVTGSAEVANVAESINNMLDRLHAQHSDLIREREKLSELAEALKAADQRKDEFLAMLAHELRNPLAPIMNWLEILKRSGGEAEMTIKARTMMERQVHHLVRLVDDLLDVSRITRGRLELRRERIEIATVIEQAIDASRPQIDSAGHELRVSHPAAPIIIDGDPVRLVQVISNLLNNAARYTERSGRIAIEVAAEERCVEIKVVDSGVGIEPQMIERVFDLFTRAHTSAGNLQGGLGIGLTLAKRLVELHDGTLTAHSGGAGRGSEFVVRLPLPADRNDVVREEVSAVPPITSRRVLVVDDNEDAAASLATLLAMIGNETRIAHDGAAALTIADDYRPDVVMLDIGLPHMDGYEVCRALRARPDGRNIFIVALTGWGQQHDRARSRDAGFDAHLVKPADYETLMAVLSGPRAASA
jgi:signal transduction histidine kinase/ActR/RegA family two-component response regulator